MYGTARHGQGSSSMAGRTSMHIVQLLLLFIFRASASTRLKHMTRHSNFYRLAQIIGTDKVTEHQYQHLYKKYLEPIKDKPLRLLEVGLGCDMPYGPGKSLQLWALYLPNSKVSFVEHDAACATKHKEVIEATGHGHIYIGDQANVTFLREIVDDQAGKLFDVIIDDGGHRMLQQKTTLKHLWQLMTPGGVFVIEDLLTSYDRSYEGGPKGHPGTTIEMLKDALDGLHCDFQTDCTPVLPELLDIDCFKEACVMVKA